VDRAGIYCSNAYANELEELFMSKANEALDRMAENARELGLDYEPDGMHHNKPQKRPQNCGTGYCSCIECVMEPAQRPIKTFHGGKAWPVQEPAQRTWVGLTDEEFQMIYDMGRTPAGMMEMVEAKLKEKNT
jgi:hypothetical protein